MERVPKVKKLSKGLIVTCTLLVTAALLADVVTMIRLTDWQSRADFGDSFGALNALFSLLAVAAAAAAVFLQREELRLQRLELAAQRRELAGQRQEFERQVALLTISAWLTTRKEAKETFGESADPKAAAERLLRVNRWCALNVDKIVSGVADTSETNGLGTATNDGAC